MLIDLAEENQRRNEPIRALTNWVTTADHDNLAEQLKLLDETCPRYDVYNVYAVLFPKLIDSDYPPARKRNAQLIEMRDTLLKVTKKAPLGRPWDNFYLECRLNEDQRGGVLVRWNGEERTYKCTIMFDSVRTEGMIEINPDAFEIKLDDDDMFGRYEFERNSAVADDDGPKTVAQLVRTTIELLNWDREDVPTVQRTHEKKRKLGGKKRHSSAKSTHPTIIVFEPFLRENMSGMQRASGGGYSSPGLHLVRGHYKNFKFESPRFGHKPALGTTYGRLWTKPHRSGNREEGEVKTPRKVIKIGKLTGTPDNITSSG